MAATGDLLAPGEVLVKTRYAYTQYPALHTDGPDPPMALNKDVFHFWPFAKYAVAFPRMSRSIVTRANSARKRAISICSAVTPDAPETCFNFPARLNFIQFHSVCSAIPRLRDASAILWPDSTKRTASTLNSSVYRPRFLLLKIRLPSAITTAQLWATFSGGKITLAPMGDLQEKEPVSVGHFVVDVAMHRVWVRGVETHLTPREFELLGVLVMHPGQLVENTTLCEIFWRNPTSKQDALRVLVGALRAKIEVSKTPQYLVTERSLGYRFYPLPLSSEES